VTNINGVGGGYYFVQSSTNGGTLTSFTANGNTYNVIGIGYIPGGSITPPATPVPATLWLAITGCLVLVGYVLWSRPPNACDRLITSPF